jgi:hypothetical protein
LPIDSAHIPVMKAGLFKQRLIALLLLVLIGAWQIAPAFAAPVCDMGTSASSASNLAQQGHCKSKIDGCGSMTICCQVSPNLMVLEDSDWLPADWRPVLYCSAPQTLVGLRLKPDLHPPTILV